MTRINRPQARTQIRNESAVQTPAQVGETKAAEASEAPGEAGVTPDNPDAIDAGVAGDFAATQGLPQTGASPLSVRLDAAAPMSQQGMNMEAAKAMREVRGAMRGANDALIDAFSGDAETQDDVRDAQSKFEGFVSREATFRSNLEARGGSMAPMLHAGVSRSLFEARAATLSAAATEGYFPGGTTANLDNANSQMEMNMAAYEAMDKANARMGELEGAIAQLLAGDPESKAEFASTQAAFKDFREAQANTAGNMEARGGSLHGLVYAGTAESITHERIQQLEVQLVQLQGEGATIPPEPADPMDVDGDGITSQAEMNFAASDGADQARAAMDNAFIDVVDKFGYDAELGPELKEAQQAFEAFADADALFYGNANARGGSMMPMLYSGRQHQLFEKRAVNLEKAAAEGYFPYQGTAEPGPNASQLEMNQAAYESYDKVKTQLDAAVGRLRTLIGQWDPESAAELDKAEAAFSDFAEKQANVAGNAEARGGSLHGLIFASAMEGLTQARLDQVNAYLEEFRQ